MKKWIAEVIILILSLTSKTYLHGLEVSSVPRSGKEIIRDVETSYSLGQYDSFFMQMHQQYQMAGKAGIFRGIYNPAKAARQSSAQKLPKARENYRNKIKQLNEQRNQKLLEAIAENPDLAIVKRVDNVAFYNEIDDDLDLLDEFDALKLQVPQHAKATIDNKIAALEVEYYIKSLLLDAGAHHKKTNSDLTKKKIALHLDKFKKMKETAQNYGEWNVLKKVERVQKVYLADQAYKIDLAALNELAIGKVDAQNTVEQKVKEIMMDYQQQKQSIIAQQ